MLRAIYQIFTKHCLSCRDAARLVSESCERRLTLPERMKLWVLRRLCPYTLRYARQVTELHDCIAKENAFEELSIAEGLSPECRERLRRELLGSSEDLTRN